MAVAIAGDVPGQTTTGGYEQTIRVLRDFLKGALGFLMHYGHPIEGGWRVAEVRGSSKDVAEWLNRLIRR